MISATIDKLSAYVKSYAGVNVALWGKDIGASEYPIVVIRQSGTGAVTVFDEHGAGVSVPMSIEAYTAKGNQKSAYDITEKVISAVNAFQSDEGRGHKMTEGISYREEGEAAIVGIEYTLRILIQRT